MTSESQIQRDIRDYLGTRDDLMIWRNNCGMIQNKGGGWVRFGLAIGSADLIGITSAGRFVAIECKAERGKLSADQERWLKLVETMGGLVIVARSVEDVKKCLP